MKQKRIPTADISSLLCTLLSFAIFARTDGASRVTGIAQDSRRREDQFLGDLTNYALLTQPGGAAQFRVAPPGFHFFGPRL